MLLGLFCFMGIEGWLYYGYSFRGINGVLVICAVKRESLGLLEQIYHAEHPCFNEIRHMRQESQSLGLNGLFAGLIGPAHTD